MTNALECENLHVTYETPHGPVHALAGLSFRIAAGTSAAVLGRSGSGKSTLLSVMATLRRPTSGRVVVAGNETSALGGRALAEFRAHTIGMVFQRHHLDPQLSALDNVLYAWMCAPGRLSLRAARARSMMLLDELGIGECAHRVPNQLSGGQGQRVAIARAAFHEPAVLLADEPTGNLDEETAGMVVDLLAAITRARGSTLVVVTHDSAVSARLDSVIHIAQGRLEAEVQGR